MKCPYCSNQGTKVVDKRETEDYVVTRRRRECLDCEKRFTTYERVETSNIIIVKKDGKREQFDRDKLKKGFIRACEKTNITMDQIETTVNEIEADIRKMDSTEVLSKALGELVMKKLKKLDKVAYIRFASVYREFQDINDFKEALKQVK